MTAKIWNQPKCQSMKELIKKCPIYVVYVNESAIKKNEILPSAITWMDLRQYCTE